MLKDKTILITGAAGFIGNGIAKKLLGNGNRVIGVDNLNNYYDVKLKKERLGSIDKCPNKKNFEFCKCRVLATETSISSDLCRFGGSLLLKTYW